MDWLTAGISLGGAILDLFGQDEASDAQRDVANRNAALMAKEAEYQKWLGDQKVADLDVYKNRLMATQRVKFAKAGVMIDDPTALAVAADSEMQYEKDVAYLKQNAQYQVERAQAGATSFTEQAKSIGTVANIQMSRTLLNFIDSARKW